MRAALLCLAACSGAAPRTAMPVAAAPAPAPVIDAPHAAAPLDPDLYREPRPPLLSIDWSHVQLGSDADALALWRQIAPTGADWQDKLYEVPVALYPPLALALLRQGGFACVRTAAAAQCGTPVPEIAPTRPDATLDDPCLRRELALWGFDQIAPSDLASIHDALRAIVAMPPPESQLVDVALARDRDDADVDARLELIARAWQAGQHEIAGAALGDLDQAHLITAVQRYHIEPALEILPASDDRAVYLAAVVDPKLSAPTRARAIGELVTAFPVALDVELRHALFVAAKAPDCELAGAAAHALAHYHALGAPKPPASLRTLCVVAGYEGVLGDDEPSPLAALVPAHGLEVIEVAPDPDDATAPPVRTAALVPPEGVRFPSQSELVDAFAHCKGTTCMSAAYEFRFTLRGGLLTRLEVHDRPPCAR